MRPTWLRTYTEANPEAFSRAMEQALDGVWAPHLEPTCLSEKTVIATLGDGSFIYGCPTSTLWAADAHGAPFLCVIYNNQLHHATKLYSKGDYPDSYSARTDNWVGIGIAPSVDFAMVAQSCLAYDDVVEDPGQVKPAWSGLWNRLMVVGWQCWMYGLSVLDGYRRYSIQSTSSRLTFHSSKNSICTSDTNARCIRMME